MKNLFLTLLILIVFVFVGCDAPISKKDAKSKLEALFHIPISDNIEISKYSTDASIQGDYTEVFVVYFKKEEFNEIFNKIKPTKFNHVNVDIYGYTIQQNREKVSAIFNSKQYSIKYTYNEE